MLCNFLGSILIARMLGAAGQGEYSLYMNLLTLSILVVGMGIPSGLVHFIASGKLERKQTFSILLTTTLILTLLIVGGFVIFSNLLPINSFFPSLLQQNNVWLWVLLMHFLGHIFLAFFQAIFQAEERFGSISLFTILGSISLLGLYSVYYFKWIDVTLTPIQWIISSLLFIILLQTLLFKITLYKQSPDYFRFQRCEWKVARPLLVFSLTAFSANLVQFFNYKLDVWIVHYFDQDTSQLGVYTLAVSLAQLVWLLPGAIHGVMYSDFSKEALQLSHIKRTSKTGWYLLAYAIFVSTIGYFLAREVVAKWFGESFSSVPEIIGILCLGIIPISAGLALSAFFAGIQKISINLKGSLIGLALCAIFDFILIPKMGIKGAAWATVISYNATILFYILMFVKIKKRYLEKSANVL